jgi:hypothetical protein
MDRYFVYAITVSDKTKKEKMIRPEVERLRGGLVECPLTAIKEHFEAIVKEANIKYTGKDLTVRLTGTGDCQNRYLRIEAEGEYEGRFCITFVPVKTVIKAL